MTFCKKDDSQLIEYQVVENGFTHAKLIDVSALQQGTYFLKMANKKLNKLYTEKIIIQ